MNVMLPLQFRHPGLPLLTCNRFGGGPQGVEGSRRAGLGDETEEAA
jgi:hypothetical protein